MEIPSTLKIGGLVWTIIFSKDVSREGSVFGSTHHTSQTIFLDPDTTSLKNEQTLIHEILHALWWQTGLDRTIGEDAKLEEKVISPLSFGLHQVLKDNNLLK